jgi:PKD repeat protein
MEKNTAIVVGVIIIVIAAAVGGWYAWSYYTFPSGQTEEPPPPPPKNKPPVAFFKGNTSGVVGDELVFDPNGTRDDDGYITTYDWDFGDGKTISANNDSKVNNTYLSPGEFTVNLTVRDNAGATDSFSKIVTIRQQDYIDTTQAVLLSRIGIDQINDTIPVDINPISLWINISFMGASTDGDAELEVIVYDPLGGIIGQDNKTTRIQQNNIDFYFDDPYVLIPGDYELIATCLKGTLYLNYRVEVRY